ncbi:hypothetical protein MSAN_02122200 [Mycena sanguinolenta]|uniref:Uncharacterized protein n=1 Tax=Mycena sanguinolenta TaxID=230812 RepID=A0A8H6XG31_9AGAR|nr:hypothetical protein MSAN_02122200 [Mycena sanguinolenta]
MSLALDSRSPSPTPQIVTQTILGLIIPGVGLTSILLSLYGYTAWKPVSRWYLDRVSFRLLTYALVAQYVPVSAPTISLMELTILAFASAFHLPSAASQLTLADSAHSCLFSAMFVFSLSVLWNYDAAETVKSSVFCGDVFLHSYQSPFKDDCACALSPRLRLVWFLRSTSTAKKWKKYYVGGVTLIALVSNVVPYASGNLGWDDVNETCWYHGKDPSEMLRWLGGTQTVWVLLASLGEVVSFIVIIGYLVVYRLVPEDTASSCASTSPRRPGSTILRFRNIVLRIGLYPIVSCVFNVSTTVIEFYLLQAGQKNVAASQQKKWRLDLANIVIYAGRPLIYGLLAATDPSFIRALHALHYPENESATLSEIHTPGLEMSTIIYLPQDDISIDGSLEAQRRVEESPTISTPNIMNPENGKMRSPAGENGTGASIDVIYHI